MKKIAALALLVLALPVAACGTEQSPTAAEPSGATGSATATESVSIPEDVLCQGWERGVESLPARERTTDPVSAVQAIVPSSVTVGQVSDQTADQAHVQVSQGGESGSYDVRKVDGKWTVVGGTGCAAAAGNPIGPDPAADECVQKAAQEAHDREWMVLCMDGALPESELTD